MPVRKRLIFFLAIIFILSAGLRLAFVRYNRESNDNHVEVIQMILKSHRLPEKADCWECFQPKLYHVTVAAIMPVYRLVRRIPEKISDSSNNITIAAELVNFVAGLITILVIGMFIVSFPVKYDALKILAFGMVALNPKLIGINSQATNDTFAILFSVLALYFTYLYLQHPKTGTFLLIVLFASLGISSKTNDWITVIAIVIALLVKAWVGKENRKSISLKAAGLVLLVVILATVNPLNQYISNYREYGSPILLNTERAPLPFFFQKTTFGIPGKTTLGNPGILSIQDGIFTFKFASLMEHPRIEYKNTPAHRTSLWAQIYGRAFSVHFDNWPPSWSTTGDQGFTLTQGIYVLSLLPTVMLLIGAVMETVVVIKSIVKRDDRSALNSRYGLSVAVFFGYMLFLVFYSLMYRDFSVMKAIFAYPAMLAFVVFLLRSGSAIYDFFSKRAHWVLRIIEGWISIAFILYCMDIVTMILQIAAKRSA